MHCLRCSGDLGPATIVVERVSPRGRAFRLEVPGSLCGNSECLDEVLSGDEALRVERDWQRFLEEERESA